LTRDNVSLSLTYSGLGPSPPSEFPATLRTTTGNALIGASTNVPGNPFTGDMGPNIFFFSRQLTSVERGNLMAFDQPS
jgi:hypothetical protein